MSTHTPSRPHRGVGGFRAVHRHTYQAHFMYHVCSVSVSPDVSKCSQVGRPVRTVSAHPYEQLP